MNASVIVPARDAQATLGRTLDALARQELEDEFEVIVVDDGSVDGTVALARAAGVRVLVQPPSGPAEARNRGVSAAQAKVLAFCDADVFPAPGWLRAGIDALRVAQLVQGRVLPDPSVALGPFDRTIWINSEVGLWEAANLFVTREVFEAVGGFEEWLWPQRGKPLAEDVLFGCRAKRLGARSSYCEQALAHHAVFPRQWSGYVAERYRLRYFPAIAAKTPELRDTFLYRRLFLNARSARFDLAAAGTLLALAARSPLPAAAAIPYLRALYAHAGRGGSRVQVAAADLAADAVGFASLLHGSVRYRSPVL